MSKLTTRCPTCKKPVEAESLSANPSFPFCNQRCRMADLHGWFEEKFVVSGEAPGEESAED